MVDQPPEDRMTDTYTQRLIAMSMLVDELENRLIEPAPVARKSVKEQIAGIQEYIQLLEHSHTPGDEGPPLVPRAHVTALTDVLHDIGVWLRQQHRESATGSKAETAYGRVLAKFNEEIGRLKE